MIIKGNVCETNIQMTSTSISNKYSPKLYSEHLAGRLTIPTVLSHNQQHIYGNITVINRDGIDHDIFPLTKQKCSIGRDLGCDIRIQRTTVSKEHAIVSIDNHKAYLQNLSENGLLLCGKFIGKTNPETRQNIDKIVLNDGDIFTISGRSFRFNYPNTTMKSINTTISKIVDENTLPTFNSPNRTPKKELLKEALNTLLPYATPTKQSKNTNDISILSPFKPCDQSTISNNSTTEHDLILFSPNTNTTLSSPNQSKRTISRFKITDISIHTKQPNAINHPNRHILGLPFLTPRPKKKINSELQDLINRNTLISSPPLIRISNLTDNHLDNESETTNNPINISNTNELVTQYSPRISNIPNNQTLSTFQQSNETILKSPQPLSSPHKSPPIAKRTRRHNIITESLDTIIAASPITGRRNTKRK